MAVKDQLLENAVVAAIRESSQVESEIKGAQRRGASSVLMNRISSEASYDIALAGGQNHVVEVRFTPSDTKFGGALCYRMFATITEDGQTRDIASYMLQRKFPDGATQRWIFSYSGYVTSYLKVYFMSQTPGTFSVQKL